MKRLFWFILVTFCLFCDADSVLKEASLEENYQEFEQFLTRIANRREYFAFYGEEPLHCNEQHILKQAEKLKIPRNLIIHALTNVTERIYLECPVRTNSYGKAFIVTTYDKSPDKLVDLTGDLEYPEFAPWIINFLSDTSHTPIYPVETFSFSYFFCLQIDVLEILPQFLTQTNIVFGERREATLSQRYEVIHDPRDKSKLLDPIYQEKLRQIDQILLENLWQVTNWHFAYFVDWLLSERYPEDYSFCIERGPLIERIPPAEFLVPHYDIDCIYWEIKRLFLFFPTTMQMRFPSLKMKYNLKGYSDVQLWPHDRLRASF